MVAASAPSALKAFSFLAPKGSDIPAQGGGIRSECFTLAAVPEPWVRWQSRSSTVSVTYRAATIGRPFRALPSLDS
jgi:hypothetical protein